MVKSNSSKKLPIEQARMARRRSEVISLSVSASGPVAAICDMRYSPCPCPVHNLSTRIAHLERDVAELLHAVDRGGAEHAAEHDAADRRRRVAGHLPVAQRGRPDGSCVRYAMISVRRRNPPRIDQHRNRSLS